MSDCETTAPCISAAATLIRCAVHLVLLMRPLSYGCCGLEQATGRVSMEQGTQVKDDCPALGGTFNEIDSSLASWL